MSDGIMDWFSFNYVGGGMTSRGNITQHADMSRFHSKAEPKGLRGNALTTVLPRHSIDNKARERGD